MRKTKYLALGLTPIAALAMGVGSVYAGTDNADITTAEALKQCLIQEGDATCTLGADIELEEFDTTSRGLHVSRYATSSGAKILNLNDKKITMKSGVMFHGGMIRVNDGGELTVKGGSNGVGLITTNTDEVTASTPESGQTYAALQTESNSKLTVESGTYKGFYYGLAGNGTNTNATVTINGGTLVGLRPNDGYGIYHPQTELLTINGGEITGGACGIEIRAGQLVMNGGVVRSTATTFSSNPNGNGTTTIGAGIALVQHTTNRPTSVVINGGQIYGPASGFAVYEGDAQRNSVTFGSERAAVSVLFNGGEFNGGINISEVGTAVNEKYVAGGTFTDTTVFDHIVPDTANVKMEAAEDNQHRLVVTPTYPATIENTNGKVNIAVYGKPYHKAGETISLDAVAVEGYEVTKVEYSVAENVYYAAESKGNGSYTFVMPDCAITIRAVYKEVEKPEAPATSTGDKEDNKGTEEDAPAAIADEKKAEKILNDTVTAMAKKDAALAAKILAAGSNVDTDITIDGIAAKDINKKIADAMAAAAEAKVKGMKIANYFDITVGLYLNDRLETNLTELTEELEFFVDVPDNLPEVPEGKTRVFYIIREHEGEATTLATKISEDGKSLIFKSNLFSTYAVGWADVDQTVGNTAGSFISTGAKSLVAVNILAGAAAVVGYALRKAFKKVRF